jgi:hypothetical protein
MGDRSVALGRFLSASNLDASLAKRDLGFVHRPLDSHLESIVAGHLALASAELPPSYRHRDLEFEIASDIDRASRSTLYRS